MPAFTLHKPADLCTKPARRGVLGAIADMLSLARQRRNLAKLDDHLLQDIGLTRHEARSEAEKPVWDVPAHWHK